MIQDWKEKFLSQASNEVLLKSVVTVIPSYAMSCFMISNKLCNSLNPVKGNFGGVVMKVKKNKKSLNLLGQS